MAAVGRNAGAEADVVPGGWQALGTAVGHTACAEDNGWLWGARVYGGGGGNGGLVSFGYWGAP